MTKKTGIQKKRSEVNFVEFSLVSLVFRHVNL